MRDPLLELPLVIDEAIFDSAVPVPLRNLRECEAKLNREVTLHLVIPWDTISFRLLIGIFEYFNLISVFAESALLLLQDFDPVNLFELFLDPLLSLLHRV